MEEGVTAQKFIDIHPLSKWKRLLVFLGDFFTSFILTFTLFNIAVFPCARVIAKTTEQTNQAILLESKASKMLIDDGYLFSPNDGASFVEDVNYTFKVFLSYYAFDDVDVDTNNPQYGHKAENEVIRLYYENVIKDTNKYIVDFKEVNEKDNMFVIGETVNDIALKADYKSLLANELLEVKDEDKYSEAMTNFRDHIFARLFYLKMYAHITENDYVKDGASYNAYYQEIQVIVNNLKWVPVVSAFISVMLSWSIVFVLYPLVNKENRTMTMSVMSISKLHYKSLGPIDKKVVMIESFYQFVAMLTSLVFLPALYYGLEYCFNLPILFVLSACSLGLIIVSGVVMIVNQYNRTGMDILTNTVLVPTSDLDNMYLENINNGKAE